jgi:hypothetical protein
MFSTNKDFISPIMIFSLLFFGIFYIAGGLLAFIIVGTYKIIKGGSV